MSPAISTKIDKNTTAYMIMGSSMSANIVDSSNAVTMYLATSISHLPNSFLISLTPH